ncbi:MAG TPA: GTPase HflX, partial [Dehalococcoidia bacterium]|nr:GTPase HflX [Dehalococcoidia bacterium]
LADASVLLHVVDITHPDAASQGETVEATLRDLGLLDKPRITVLNKVDQLVDTDGNAITSIDELAAARATLAADNPDAVLVSAQQRWGLDELRERVIEVLEREPVRTA